MASLMLLPSLFMCALVQILLSDSCHFNGLLTDLTTGTVIHLYYFSVATHLTSLKFILILKNFLLSYLSGCTGS